MARRQTQPEQGSGIVVLYTSLMILLLAFFILLNTMGKVEESKVETALKSLRSGFGLLPGSDSPIAEGGLNTSNMGRAPIMPVEQDYRVLRGLVGQRELGKEVLLLRSAQQRTVVLTAGLLFEPGSTRLTPRAQEFLKTLAELFKDRLYPVSIYGHTDLVEMEGPRAGQAAGPGWELSARRALAVLRELAAQGVEARRLAAFGLGRYRPLVGEGDPEHARLNNRVELILDARDANADTLPDSGQRPSLDFRGFRFDLLPEGQGR